MLSPSGNVVIFKNCELGRGGESIVYMGKAGQATVAVKVMRGSRKSPEADILRALPPHPNVGRRSTLCMTCFVTFCRGWLAGGRRRCRPAPCHPPLRFPPRARPGAAPFPAPLPPLIIVVVPAAGHFRPRNSNVAGHAATDARLPNCADGPFRRAGAGGHPERSHEQGVHATVAACTGSPAQPRRGPPGRETRGACHSGTTGAQSCFIPLLPSSLVVCVCA